jgi:MtN3 and saliva related transmembrane protein
MTEVIGYAAAILTTSAFLPQVVKVWKTRSVADISLRMYALFTSGVACWLIYGILKGVLPIILANGVTLALAGCVLVAKLKYGRR